MLKHKVGQLSGVMTLYWATVVVFVIMVIFIASSTLLITFIDIKTGVDSRKLVSIESYMDEYANSFEENYEVLNVPVESCGTGEVWSKYFGKCVCDAYHGWMGQGGNELSYDPPCVHVRQGSLLPIMDSSLDNEINDPNEVGFCIGYYSKKYLYYMLTKPNPSQDDINLLNYPIKPNYVKKINEHFMADLSENTVSHEYSMTRSQCWAHNRDWTAYVIFVSSPINNLDSGLVDDLGLCAYFESGQAINLFRSSRDNCKQIADSDTDRSDYSFFVSEKGTGISTSTSSLFNDAYLMGRYFPNFNTRDDDDNLIEGDYIDDKVLLEGCPDYFKYDLVFITGISDYLDEALEEGYDTFYRRRARSACSRVWREVRDTDDEIPDDKAYTFEYSVLDSEKGDVCCYGEQR